MALLLVNEKSTAYLTVEFTDKNGDPAVPASATYSIYEPDLAQEVRAETEITVLGSSIEIVLAPSDNAVLNRGRSSERRIVTVSAVFGTGDELHDEYEYGVKNLARVSP